MPHQAQRLGSRPPHDPPDPTSFRVRNSLCILVLWRLRLSMSSQSQTLSPPTLSYALLPGPCPVSMSVVSLPVPPLSTTFCLNLATATVSLSHSALVLVSHLSVSHFCRWLCLGLWLCFGLWLSRRCRLGSQGHPTTGLGAPQRGTGQSQGKELDRDRAG